MENQEITVADLEVLQQVIEVACARGLFKAAEMSQVGPVYDRLISFLHAVKEQARSEMNQSNAQSQGE